MGYNWQHDLTPSSGQNTGADAVRQLWKPENSDLDSLIRDAVQNSKDRALKGRIPQVHIDLIELEGAEKDRFLKTADWKTYEPQVRDASLQANPAVGPQLEEGIQDLNGSKLRLLRISDFRTEGLTGGHFDSGSNFKSLCVDSYVSGNSNATGGSNGLGKYVYWRFSKPCIVLFSSVPADKSHRLRMIGRSELASHEHGGESFQKTGWFGQKTTSLSRGSYQESIWDDHASAKKLRIDRPVGAEKTGTTILVVSFYEPKEDKLRPLPAIADDIRGAIAKWFWPALSGTTPALEVHVGTEDKRGGLNRTQVRLGPEWQPFIDAYHNPPTVKKIDDVNDIAGTTLPFDIPALTKGDKKFRHKRLTHHVEIKATKLSGAGTPTPLENHFARIRGFQMVVSYQKLTEPPDGNTVFGVVKVGTAAGNTADHRRAEEFFRASESALHDNWELTDNKKAFYPGKMPTSFSTLLQSSKEAIENLYRPDFDRAHKPLNPLLQSLLRISQSPDGAADSAAAATQVSIIWDLSSNRWKISGTIDRPPHVKSAKWAVYISVKSKAAMGSENLEWVGTPRLNVPLHSPYKANVAIKKSDDGNTLEFSAPKGLNHCGFTAEAKPASNSDLNKIAGQYKVELISALKRQSSVTKRGR